jgi:hypothetical protein
MFGSEGGRKGPAWLTAHKDPIDEVRLMRFDQIDALAIGYNWVEPE